MTTDADLARRLARSAGLLLLELRRQRGPIGQADRVALRELRDAADRASHEFIASELSAARPADAVLSEEGKDSLDRDRAERVWIVDPLDGTSEFGQGRSDFAVHIALWERQPATGPTTDVPGPSGSRLVAGCVDLPAQAVTYSSADSGQVSAYRAGDPVRVVVSRSRPPELVADTGGLERLFAAAGVRTGVIRIARVGSVGAKVAEVLAGRADLYVHDSGFYEWDVAAPLIVAQHYGLRACHLDGTEVTFNHRPPWVRDLVVGHPALVAAVVRRPLG